MKIIFLGCGYLGYNLSTRLMARHDVQMWGIDSPYRSIQKNFTYVNVLDPNSLSQTDMRDAVVIDTVGLVANTEKSEEEAQKLQDLRKIYASMLEVIKCQGAKCFVFLSSGGTVYGNCDKAVKETDKLHPTTLYAKSKVMLEELIEGFGIPYLIIRLANPYGGYQFKEKRQGVIPILIRRILLHETFEQWVSGDTVRDYLYIDDFAKMLESLLEKGVTNEVVNVGSGIATTLDNLITDCEAATGMSLNRVIHPDESIVGKNWLDISKFKQLTGIVPEVSLKEGIIREVIRIKEEENL